MSLSSTSIPGFSSHASRGNRATVSPRIPSPNSCNPSTRDPRRARFPRRSCYKDRTLPEAYCATVSPSALGHATRYSHRTLPEVPVLQWSHAFRCAPCYSDLTRPECTVLQCHLAAPTRATRHPGIPVTFFSRRLCYSDRMLPEAYYATVIARILRRVVLQCPPSSPSSCNPAHWYSRCTLPEATVLQ